MKNWLVGLVIGGFVCLGVSGYSQGTSGRIVTVDLNRVFNEYYKTPIATDKLKETVDSYKKEQEELLAEYRKEIDELNKLRDDADKPEYTEKVREEKKKAVQDKLEATKKTQNEIAEYQRSHQQILEQQTQRMRQTILNEIKDVVNQQAKDAGYIMVIDKSGNTLNGTPTLVYSLDTMDITDDIVKSLNKNQPKSTEMPKPAMTQPAPSGSPETSKTNAPSSPTKKP